MSTANRAFRSYTANENARHSNIGDTLSTTRGTQLATSVVRYLREQITTGAWPLHSRIPTEAQLTAELGVGRSTIREAIRSLASLGLLESAPGRGTFVRSINPVSAVLTDYLNEKELVDILSIRRTLEIEAARRAAVAITPEHLERLRAAYRHEVAQLESGVAEGIGDAPGGFHLALVEASDNTLLLELYTGLAAAVRHGIRDGRISSAPQAEKIADHAKILEAIETRDIVAAVHAANDHGDRDLVYVPEKS